MILNPALLLVGAMLATMGSEGRAGSHDDSFSKDGLLKADVAKLPDTELLASPEAPLDPAKNVLWCGTLQLAWNELIGLLGEKPQFVNAPPEVAWLNREDFTRADLDAHSYVAVADLERNGVEDKIRAALQETFHGEASPELIPPKPANPGPDDLVAYAYLYKNLAFADPFEDNPPLDFGGRSVENFGFIEHRDAVSRAVFAEVAIQDYKSPTDFVIELKTKASDDQLILAKVAPKATLAATVASVLRRMSPGKALLADERDQLAVPKLNFDLRGDFPKLEGLALQPGPDAKIKNLKTTSVKQLVRFQLNEKGAILKSEAALMMTATAVFNRPPPHIMIFNKPFLILMKQANSARPYFALWIGNASLLVPAK